MAISIMAANGNNGQWLMAGNEIWLKVKMAGQWLLKAKWQWAVYWLMCV